MLHIYSTLGAITTFLSAVATAIIIARLHHHWVLHISSVRWLFFMFFVYLCVWTSSRCAFFIWMLCVGSARRVDRSIEKVLTTTQQLDSFGVHSVPISNLSHNWYLTAVVIVGNVALFALALWMVALTYELAKIATKSMDRGPKLEAKAIRLYAWVINGSILAFACVQFGIAIRDGGYSIPAHKCLLVNFAAHVLGLGFMVGTLAYLKVRGRKYEAMHGTFIPSPVYQRLKRIITVYAFFATHFQIASIILCTTGERRPYILAFIGVSMVIYSCTGLALSIITGCSQSCVFRTFSACMPGEMEAQFMQRKFAMGTIAASSVAPPQKNPIFVYTDIEASSALWALADCAVMEAATSIHDNILRSSLLRHNGYEIATCGDSFQLAFPSIGDAVSYCVDVQLQLLVAPWPKELHGLIPATKRQRSGHRLIFSGLRVRMGIHDSIGADGALVCERHAVTGKMTYTGASEAIADEVGDLGYGGQILVTHRVAAWVQVNRDDLDVDMKVAFLGHFHMPALDCEYDVFQLVPSVLAARCKHWPSPSARLTAPSSSSLPWSRRAETSVATAGLPVGMHTPMAPISTQHREMNASVALDMGGATVLPMETIYDAPERASSEDCFVPFVSAMRV